MERVIVTGANGFIGKNLIKELVSRNIEVYAIDIRFNDKILDNGSISCLNCSELSMEQMENQLARNESYDCFIHLAWAGTSGPSRGDYVSQLDNVKLACDYIQFAKKVNCKRFIYASSINEMETYEYMQSDDIKPSGGYIYGTGKLTAHLMGEVVAYQNEIEFIPIIITNIYGVGEKSARLINTSIRKLLNKEHCSFTEGKQTYDFIYITDAINSVVEVANKGIAFNRYYIGSGNPRPLREFLLDMKDVVDSSAQLGLGDFPFNGKDISYDQFKLKKVEEDTGYKNKVSFKEGIKLTDRKSVV